MILNNVKADDVKVIPVCKDCDWVDYMVFATCKSTWHVKNIAQALIYQRTGERRYQRKYSHSTTLSQIKASLRVVKSLSSLHFSFHLLQHKVGMLHLQLREESNLGQGCTTMFD